MNGELANEPSLAESTGQGIRFWFTCYPHFVNEQPETSLVDPSVEPIPQSAWVPLGSTLLRNLDVLHLRSRMHESPCAH